MTGPRRRKVPLRAQLEAALRQLGLEPKEVELDHRPPLALREVASDGQDWVPSQADSRYLVWMPKAEHRRKTSGKRHDASDGDTHRIAKAKRLTTAQQDFRRRLIAKDAGEEKPRSRWPRRKMRAQDRNRGAHQRKTLS